MQHTAIEPTTVDELFANASQIYVGVISGGQPHVTPELFATGDGRLWCMTAVGTRKVKVLANDDRVAFLASSDRGDVIGIGRASVLDPLKPKSLARPAEAVRSAIGSARFVARNSAELTGAVVDALAGKLGRPLPPHRVVLSIEPTALALDTADGLQSWGDWEAGDGASELDGSSAADSDDSDAANGFAELLDDGPAALGWLSQGGHPLVLPARWSKSDSSAQVGSTLFDRSGGSPSSPAALTRDAWTGYGPTGKQGVMLRGQAEASISGNAATAVIAVDRLTYWDGVETGSTPKP